MLNQINYTLVDENQAEMIFGNGVALGFGLVATFGIVATVMVVLYKIFGAKQAEVTLPGGFKFEFEGE